jgi:N-acetylmuramic acid 6-phosphate etherase
MLEKLTTEARNSKTMNLDEMEPLQILKVMNDEDKTVPLAIEKVLPPVEKIVKRAIETLRLGGRIIYLGAGTSGRLGVLDAVECTPTFGTTPDMVIGLIAGGDMAFLAAVEGAEDSEQMAVDELSKLQIDEKDLVIGIAASGRTPYVIGGLKYANEKGAYTGSISCNKLAEISKHARVAIEIETGSEVLTGSTRLKAGTAQKLVLNMISTAAMVGIGKVYKNLMVDVQPTNLKLVERSKRIIMQATGIDYETAQKYYSEANGNVKIAIVMILTNCSSEDAKHRLDDSNGFVRNAL